VGYSTFIIKVVSVALPLPLPLPLPFPVGILAVILFFSPRKNALSAFYFGVFARWKSVQSFKFFFKVLGSFDQCSGEVLGSFEKFCKLLPQNPEHSIFDICY
jgi:hypothetical protein